MAFRAIALICRFDDLSVAQTMESLAELARLQGIRTLVDIAYPVAFAVHVERLPVTEFAARADLLVAVGGDGTLLRATQLAAQTDIPLLGVNHGPRGFLTDITGVETQQHYIDVLCGRYTSDRRCLLDARIANPTGPALRALALNDVVLQKNETGHLLDLETWIDGCFVNTRGGDGLVVAGATGSTAYALSCGGPILHPDVEAVVLAPISPHMLSDRPIVIGRRSTIDVRLMRSSRVGADVACDGVALGDLAHGGRLTIGPAIEHVTLLHPPGYDYYRNLRSRLYWGRGGRHGRVDA